MLTELNSLAITQFINSQVVTDNSPLSVTASRTIKPRLALAGAN
jgi:hypothetical protein